jgi:hypothetical protein
MLQNLACKVEWLLGEKSSLESVLQDLVAQKEDLDVRLRDTENRMKELESQLQEEKFNRLYQLLGMLLLNVSSVYWGVMLCHNWTHLQVCLLLCTSKYLSLLNNAQMEGSFITPSIM